jgi:hypothetical protein
MVIGRSVELDTLDMAALTFHKSSRAARRGATAANFSFDGFDGHGNSTLKRLVAISKNR